jgi:hypothetical protein
MTKSGFFPDGSLRAGNAARSFDYHGPHAVR